MSNLILSEVADCILRVKINRPDKKNALTVGMYAELAAALGRATSEPAVRVVLIHGHPQVFTGGNDLADFMNPTCTCQVRRQDRPAAGLLDFAVATGGR